MWTTTPWTLVSNTAVAVRPDVSYVVASDGDEKLVVAESLVRQALGDGWTVEDSLPGAELEHWAYSRPFTLVDFPAPAHYVVLADYVTTEDGTGLVHQSPAFGEEDMRVARAYGLPVVNPVRPDGRFVESTPLVGGQFFKHADATLVADLESRGLMFKHLAFEHSYPHCWRCHTPLMYYAQPSWYIRTTAIKDELLAQNETTTWFPETIKWGRYGDWLAQQRRLGAVAQSVLGDPAADLALPGRITRHASSRSPSSGGWPERTCPSSTRTGRSSTRSTLPCPECGQEARRVLEVIDAWYDSGSMPFAQWGYPHVEGSAQRFKAAYPAQFICEAIDQTRGWFYTLMAIGTLVFHQSAYENVLCLGHIVAEDGRKMSKHLGNILEPLPLMHRHGADGVRWFMLASGSPWAARRIGHNAIQEGVRKVLLTYWNTASFHVLYARTAGWKPGGPVPPVEERPVLDRWLVSATTRLTTTSPSRWTPSTPSVPASSSRSSWTTCPTGTCAGRGAGSGAANPARSARCTTRSRCSTEAGWPR